MNGNTQLLPETAVASLPERQCLLLVAVLTTIWIMAYAVRCVPLPDPQPGSAAGGAVYDGFSAASLDHAASVVQAGILLLSGMGLGAWVLRRLGFGLGDPLSRAAFGAGVGLGGYSLAALGLGTAGWLNPYVFAAIPLVALAVGRRDLCSILGASGQRLARGISEFSYYRILIWTIAIFLLLLHVVWAFIPPFEYDVLEYHLAAPKLYWQAGRVFFIHDNVYANFPQNVEMLYLWALVLKGELFRGLYLAQLLNVAFGVWAAAAVACAAGRMFGDKAAAPAALLFYMLPWTSEVSRPAYVELALTGYAVLTVVAFCEYAVRPGWRWAVLAGICAGIAAGCKYPAALFLVLPLLIGIVVAGGSRRYVFAAGVAALLAASPWLIRNTINTGNPVYPLLYSVFGGETFSGELAAKFARAHGPQTFAAGEMLHRTARFFTQGDMAGRVLPLLRVAAYLPVCALSLLALLRMRGKKTSLAVCSIVVSWLLWLLFTHRIGRFLVPWTSIAAALAGGGLVLIRPGWLAKVVMIFAMLVAAIADMPQLAAQVTLPIAVFGTDGPALLRDFTSQSPSPYSAYEKINALGPNATTLFIGEAQTLYCTGKVIAPTVFDRHLIEELLIDGRTADEIAAELRRLGITHIYVNLSEFIRLRYSFDYQYKFNGADRQGLWNLTDAQWKTFGHFMWRYTRLEYAGGGPLSSPRRDHPDDHRRFHAFVRQQRPQPGPIPHSRYIYRLIADE